MAAAPCYKCRQPADHMQQVSREAAMVHDMLYGGGVYIAPGEGFVLPVCHDCNPWGASNGHTWTYDGVCVTCGLPEQDNPPYCAIEDDDGPVDP